MYAISKRLFQQLLHDLESEYIRFLKREFKTPVFSFEHEIHLSTSICLPTSQKENKEAYNHFTFY